MNPFSGLRQNLSSASLSKKITEVWNLLNETAILVNRTAVGGRYAGRLAVLRAQLQKAPANPNVIKEVYTGITGLRQNLRLSGYDLSMGKYALIFDGFRNDDSLGSGFRRVVVFIGTERFYFRTGDDNHLVLAAALENQLAKNPRLESILEIHSLWFQRTKTSFTLSGSATETAEDYQKLKERGEADSLLFLSRLKGLY
ncbi:MAG: hypothetical protein LBH35_01130 [Treponema sp.]|jgi:hypothetical protein|nr:hypothetical protein [Treponema sp.]